jgi:hypothetical protein
MRSTITAKAIAPCKMWEEGHYRHAQLAGRVWIVGHRSMMASTPAQPKPNVIFILAKRRRRAAAGDDVVYLNSRAKGCGSPSSW